MQNTSKSNRRILFRFVLSYMILLIIPIMMGASSYHSAVHLTRENLITTNETVLKQSCESVASSLEAADQFVKSLSSMNSIFLQILTLDRKVSGSDVYLVRNAIDTLPLHLDSMGLMEEYFVFLQSCDIILSRNIGYMSSYDYYCAHFKDSSFSYSEWYENISSGRTNCVRSLRCSDTESLLYYCFPASVVSGGKTSYRVVFTIKLKNMDSIVQPLFDTGAECVYILGSNGNILAGFFAGENTQEQYSLADIDGTRDGSGFVTINGEQMLLSVSRQDTFSMISLIPNRVIMKEVSGMMMTISLYLIAFIAAELLLGIWIAGRNQQPLNRMLTHLKNVDTDRKFSGDLSSVERAVHQLAQNTQLLEDKLETQKNMLHAAYVNRLILGDIMDESDLEAQLEQVGVTIDGNIMRGIYMVFNSEKLIDYQRAKILRILEDYKPCLQLIRFNSANCMALLFAAADTEKQRYAVVLRRLSNVLREQAIETTFYIGRECVSLKQVSDSFASAEMLISAPDKTEGRIFFEAEEDKTDSEALSFLLREELKLQNQLTVGNIDAVRELLQDFRREYFGNRRRSEFERSLVYSRILGVLLSVHPETPLSLALRTSYSALQPSEFFAQAEQYCEHICSVVLEQKKEQTNQLTLDIGKYLDDHYCDPEISLCSVADVFGLTETGLSLFVKEKIGENFSNRIERLRIEKAERLLTETSLGITEIAEKVGYTNANTFRRAYRRVKGVSPSEARASLNT